MTVISQKCLLLTSRVYAQRRAQRPFPPAIGRFGVRLRVAASMVGSSSLTALLLNVCDHFLFCAKGSDCQFSLWQSLPFLTAYRVALAKMEFHCIYSYSVRISDWAACSPDRSRSGQPGLSSVWLCQTLDRYAPRCTAARADAFPARHRAVRCRPRLHREFRGPPPLDGEPGSRESLWFGAASPGDPAPLRSAG